MMNSVRYVGVMSMFVGLLLWCTPSFADSKSVTAITAQANQGDPVAEYELGNLFKGGEQGLAQNYDEAEKWYRKAAEQGYAPAESAYATRLMRVNKQEAYNWYQKAADQGDETAKFALRLRKSSFPKTILIFLLGTPVAILTILIVQKFRKRKLTFFWKIFYLILFLILFWQQLH